MPSSSASASVLDRAANALVVFRQAGYHHAVHQQDNHCQDETSGDDFGDDGIRILLQRETLKWIWIENKYETIVGSTEGTYMHAPRQAVRTRSYSSSSALMPSCALRFCEIIF